MLPLSDEPVKAVLLMALDLPVGFQLCARVGRKGSNWDHKGSNDGATSEDATDLGQVSLGWNVVNTFNRTGDMELHIRILSSPARLVGRELVGEIKHEFKNFERHEIKVLMTRVFITIGDPKKVLANYPDSVPRTHPCGTNHFGMLPEGIGALTPSDLQDCILWGEAHEPMRNWVGCHLIYKRAQFKHGDMLVRNAIARRPKVFNFKAEEVDASVSGVKAGYGITLPPDNVHANAVPMLEFQLHPKEEGGERKTVVVQDGVMINYLIIPVLYPQKCTEDIFRWERKIGYELIPAMWRDYDGLDYANLFQRTLPNYPRPFRATWNPILRWPGLAGRRLMNRETGIIASYIGEEYDPRGATIRDIFQLFKKDLGEKEYMGGLEPNPTDVSFYGVNILRYVTNVGPHRAFFEECMLTPWMERMMAKIPPSECLKMEYFGPSFDGWKGGWLCDPPQFEPVKLTD